MNEIDQVLGSCSANTFDGVDDGDGALVAVVAVGSGVDGSAGNGADGFETVGVGFGVGAENRFSGTIPTA